MSPELVLVLPEEQRAAAIQALPSAPVWSPGPLGPAVRVARHPAVRGLIAAALLYFALKLLWTLGIAVAYVVTIVAVVIGLTLIF